MIANVESVLSKAEIFGDTADTLKEGVEQHRERECLKGVISTWKEYLLGGKKQGTHESVDKGSNETANEMYAEYKQCELNEKGEKTGRVLGKHVISVYSTCFNMDIFS